MLGSSISTVPPCQDYNEGYGQSIDWWEPYLRLLPCTPTQRETPSWKPLSKEEKTNTNKNVHS